MFRKFEYVCKKFIGNCKKIFKEKKLKSIMNIKKSFKNFIKNNISFFILLGSLLFFYIMINILIYFGIIPDKSFLVGEIKEIYSNYGSLIIFFSTLFEGFLFFGLYYPGSALLIFIIFTATYTLQDVLLLTFLVISALSINSFFHYFIGYKSTYLKNLMNKKRDIKKKKIEDFLFFLHPTILAYKCFSLGVERRSIRELLFILFIVYWYGFFLIYTIIFLREGFFISIN